ncbi:hypothetical protein V6N11_019998 [Hibiscus sabdariffa]|uniref:Uncharacterized protein n=1 Tax=Hibiscus sabdariffa TaxID=183260 RepID=A0ABR1ZFR0_9ROSI
MRFSVYDRCDLGSNPDGLHPCAKACIVGTSPPRGGLVCAETRLSCWGRGKLACGLSCWGKDSGVHLATSRWPGPAVQGWHASAGHMHSAGMFTALVRDG